MTVDGAKVAGQNDFDDTTGEIKESKSSRATSKPILVLDHGKTIDVLSWLASSKTDSSTSRVSYQVSEVEEKQVSKKPPVPFITSSLQQVSSTLLGLPPSRTMSVAQELYEEGFITYMRTDSPVLSNLAKAAAESIVEETFGVKYVASQNMQQQQAKKKTAGKSDATQAPKNAQEVTNSFYHFLFEM